MQMAHPTVFTKYEMHLSKSTYHLRSPREAGPARVVQFGARLQF